ncbi:MAG: glyoxylase I family protein [Hyphomicrobiaceae bacterium]|jgi:glyoxylase I family protein
MSIAIRAHHMSFPVRDLARSRAFYEELFAVEELPRPDMGFPGVWYRVGTGEIHLLEIPEGVETAPPPATLNPLDRHAAFSIPNYQEALAELEGRGIEVLATSVENGQMWLLDPDGHILELICPPA